MIIQAEKFCTSVNAPPGKDQTVEVLQGLDIDDQFFHVTCHIDPGLKQKIEKGEFVDLEKLLPKSRKKMQNEGKLDLVFKDGHSFFVPTQNEGKINGIRK